jgi:putative oxidoreductase
MGRLVGLVSRVYERLERAEWLARLLARVAVGLMFFGSGLGKATRLSSFVAYFRSLGIPAPDLQAPFVAGVELICGALLILGLGTRPAAALLSGVMIVALGTAAIPEHHVTASWKGLLDFLYLPEWLLLLLLVWLLLAGAGRASLDAMLDKRQP